MRRVAPSAFSPSGLALLDEGGGPFGTIGRAENRRDEIDSRRGTLAVAAVDGALEGRLAETRQSGWPIISIRLPARRFASVP
jgi:hypothetical protein